MVMSKLPATTPALKQVKIMLPAALHTQLRQQAAENGLSLAAFLRSMLYRQLSVPVKHVKIKANQRHAGVSVDWDKVRQIL